MNKRKKKKKREKEVDRGRPVRPNRHDPPGPLKWYRPLSLLPPDRWDPTVRAFL
jgi:hypothetical protein